MAVQTFTSGANYFKRVYVPDIRDMLNGETPGLGMLAKSGKERWSGADVRTAQRIGRNRSYRVTGSANSGAAFPTAGRQTIGNFTIGCRLLHATGGLEAFAQAASQGSEGAFESILRAEVKGMLADNKKELEIDFYGNELGILAKVNGDPGGGTTLTLDQDLTSLIAYVGAGNRYFSAGQRIAFVDEVTGDIRGTTGVVSSVSTANRTQLVLEASIAAIQDNDLVVREGTWGAAGVAAGGANAAAAFSFTGLESIIDDADASCLPADALAGAWNLDSLQGVDRSTAGGAYAQSSVLDLNASPLTRDVLHNLTYLVEERGNTYPDVFLCPRSVQLAIANLMVGDQRYQPQEFPGGFKSQALLFNGGDKDIPIVVSRECPARRLYALNFECLEEFVLQDYELIETDGAFLRQDSGGGDVWNFTMRKFSNIGTLDPRGLGKLVRVGGVDETYGAGAGRLYDL